MEVQGMEAGAFSLTGAEVYPSGDSVAVGLHYTATSPVWETEGTIWVTGRPELDAAAKEIRIVDFDYALDSWELNAAGANNETIRGLIRDQLTELLVVPFDKPIAEKMTEANAQLGKVQTPKGTLQAKLDEVAVQELFFSEEALNLRVAFLGNAKMALAPEK